MFPEMRLLTAEEELDLNNGLIAFRQAGNDDAALLLLMNTLNQPLDRVRLHWDCFKALSKLPQNARYRVVKTKPFIVERTGVTLIALSPGVSNSAGYDKHIVIPQSLSKPVALAIHYLLRSEYDSALAQIHLAREMHPEIPF